MHTLQFFILNHSIPSHATTHSHIFTQFKTQLSYYGNKSITGIIIASCFLQEGFN